MTQPDRAPGLGAPRRIRRRLGPWVDRLARRLGEPVYRVRPEGYVGAVDLAPTAFERWLSERGFDWDPLALYHYTPEDNAADGSWVYRESPFADRQVHVVLVDQFPDHVDVYAHEEPNWLRHPIAHARQQDIDPATGAARMRRWLDEQGVDHERETLVRRKAEHLLTRFLRSPRQP
ncbi:hypothetical protein ACKVMT_14595 [Halobacteriales archaeon Cl-PHB]